MCFCFRRPLPFHFSSCCSNETEYKKGVGCKRHQPEEPPRRPSSLSFLSRTIGMESSSFKEPRRWAEASSPESGKGEEAKQKIRFNLEERIRSVEESVSQSDFTNLITSLVQTNKLLHQELEQIQKDHQRTIKTLSHCCRLKRSEEKHPEHIPRGILKGFSKPDRKSGGGKTKDDMIKVDKGKNSKTAADSIVKPREISSCSSSSNPESEDETVSFSNDSSAEESASSGYVEISQQMCSSGQPGCMEHRSCGMDTIKSMWDNFSLKDYDFITYVDGPIVKSKQSSSHRARKCTVPEPFNMTVRESAKKKHKTEEIPKLVVEDTEKDVRVQPVRVPPSTLMPIYELMRERDEQKKVERKKEVVNKMKNTLKPFSFEARETQKKEKKEELMKIEDEADYSKPKSFKARPVPSKLFDLEARERVLEEEDYRRIRRRMRSDELLARSKLPNRMHESANKTDLCKKVADEDDDYWFHPRISHEIPNYEEGHTKFCNKLAERKRSKLLTVPEPFHLKTEEVSLRRNRKAAFRARREAEMKTKKNRSSSRLHLTHQPVLSAHTTQAQKLRQKKIEERMSVLQVKEMEEEERHKARKVERHMMQKIVKEAADKMYSATVKLEEKRKKQAEERR